VANINIAKIGIVNMRFHGIVNGVIVKNKETAFVSKSVLPAADLLELKAFIRQE
jgi:hypothetical protein